MKIQLISPIIMRIPVNLTATLLLIAILTYVLNSAIPYDSVWVEKYYFNGFYRSIRWIWSKVLSHSPIGLIYPALFLLLLTVAEGLRRLYHLPVKRSRKLIITARTFLQFVCLVYVLFYWLWGFNYKRPDFLTSLIPPTEAMSPDELFVELIKVTDTLENLRTHLKDDLGIFVYRNSDEEQIRRDLEQTFDAAGVSYHGRVRVRQLRPKGSLLIWSTAGVYLPFVGEGHLDPGLHGITWPFTISHEMTHGYGITSEDSCNFWAFVACINSPRPLHRYSGYFGYWRYLVSNARRADKDRFATYWESIDPQIKKDAADVWAYSGRFPALLPALRDIVYDNYLKSHGIEEGLRSYSRIITLVRNWRNTYGSTELTKMSQTQGKTRAEDGM